MVTVTIENDFQFNLAQSAGVVGQQPHKKETKLDSIGNWTLRETLDGLTEFTFSARNDEHEKANILMERNISVPFLTPFNGIITQKKPGKATVDFTAVEDAWHFTRKKFFCHDKRRIKYTQEDWFNKLWRFRRKITIQGKKFHDLSTGSDLLNFPLLFHTIDSELKTHARSDGFDILFTKTENDGTVTQLQHEIESYDFSTGELWVWLEFPEIRSGQNEEFEMYFGNENSVNQQNITGTWDYYLTGFNMVQHLNINSVDSTSNNNDGTDTSITYVSGKVANAAHFDGVNSKIDLGSGATIDNLFAANGWLTTWINPGSDGEGSVGLVFDKVTSRLITQNEAAGLVRLRFEQSWDAGVTTSQWDTGVIIPVNEFTRIDIVYNNSLPANNPTIYINGNPFTVGSGLTETVAPGTTADSDAANNLIIGNNTGQTATYDGTIEEFRMLKLPPTNISELIKIEFANEKDPESYFVVGQAEEYIRQADIIAESIIRSANRDMPILNTTPVPGLVSLWEFDGDVLDSKSSSNGTWVGTQIYTKGSFNTSVTEKCAKFNGASRVTTTDAPFAYSRTVPFSFQVKVKTTSVTESILVSKRVDLTAANAGYVLGMTAAGLPFVEISNGTTDYIVTGVTPINDGDWHTVGFTFDGSSNQSGMKLYENGFLNATGAAAAITGTTTNTELLTFGAGSAGASPFTGNLDDFRIYSTELTAKFMDRLSKMTQSDLDIIQTKVQWKLGDGHVTDIDNLVSLWKFDQALVDSKDDHNLHLHAGVETFVDVKYAKGFSLLGTEFFHVHGDQTDYDFEYTNSFSIALWFKGNTSATAEEIITKHNGTTGWRWAFNASDNLIFEVDDGTNSRVFTVTTDLRDNILKHLAVTYDGTSTGCKMYSDGVALVVTPGGTFPTSTIINTGVVFIGATTGVADKLTANIDDMRVYRDVLTPVEVKRLAEATDSGIDRIRDDNIPTRLLEIDFNHKDHLECLKKIARELSVNIFFDSKSHRVFIKNKGKTISPHFDKMEINKPNFDLGNVANVINVVGATDDTGLQKEKTFEETNDLKYNYERTFTDGQIATNETLDLVGANIVSQLQDLKPDLTIKTTTDQYNRFDIQTGDTLNISELDQDLQGIFRVITINLNESSVTLSLSQHTNSTVQTTGRDLGGLLSGIIKQIQDVTIKPE